MANETNLRAGRPLRVVVMRKPDDAQRARIAEAAPDAEVTYLDDDSDLPAVIADADIVAGLVPERHLAGAASLKWIHSWVAGPNDQLFPALVDSKTVLTCSKSNGAIPLAEHAMMLMLMLNRQAMRWIDAQREHRWDRFRHAELNGLTCGIIGTGHSGTDLALKARAFHMRVIGLRRRDVPAPTFDAMFAARDLHAFLAESDFVVVTAPLTEETRGMLGEAEFRAMKRTAHYICFSRGGIADDDALCRALEEGWIAGAGLDAHSEEPLPSDSRFWDLPNVIVTPHNGATTWATFDRSFDIFVDNLGRYVRGEPLVNVVDKQSGY